MTAAGAGAASGDRGPRVLVVTSAGSPPAVVTPVLAALEAHGLRVRAIDVGRVGSRAPGAAWRMLRALVGELGERRLLHELEQHPPDVALAFDPGSAAALAAARDEAARPAPVLALVPELDPRGEEWDGADADRYLVVDDHAAVALSDGGVSGHRVMPVGPICPVGYAQAGRQARAQVRSRFKLPESGLVILVEVAGLGYEDTSQLALQLSLLSTRATYLFAAGDDVDAATALRRQVPTLGLKAKLFGHTSDAPLLWRAADVVVARPRPLSVARAMAVGALVVAMSSGDDAGQALVQGLEHRRVGLGAQGPLFVSSALEAVLAARGPEAGAWAGEDGAANTADVAWVVGQERDEIIGAVRAAEQARTRDRVQAASRAARAAERQQAAAGELEDLGGDAGGGGASAGGAPAAGAPPPPDRVELGRLRQDLERRIARAQRTVADAQKGAARWQGEVESMRKAGSESGAREAERNADLERARMHASLAELAELSKQLEALEEAARVAPPRRDPAPPPPGAGAGHAPGARQSRARAPRERSVDDLLDELKQRSGTGTSTRNPQGKGAGSGSAGTASAGASTSSSRGGRRRDNSVDDELEALKRKMSGKSSGKPRGRT